MTSMLARCDGGGLASLTAEVHRHLAPERTLLLDLGDRGRGDCTTGDYQHGDVYRCDWYGGLSRDAVDWITADPGTLWSAETFYDDQLLPVAHQHGMRTILYAMPELAPWAADPGHRPRPRAMFVPTSWRADTLPSATVLPMPVARDRLPFSHREQVAHLYHVTGAAMKDRQGTDLLIAAIPHVHERCVLTIRSERPINLLPGGNVDVEVITSRTANYWDCVPPETDLHVMPRRYGGLSLPLQECASLGIPTLTLSSDAYAGLPFVHSLSPTKSESVTMKGGRNIPVWTADPRALANAIDHLIRNPDVNAVASTAADRWAEQHAWHGELGAKWCRALSAGCAEEIAA